MRVPGFMDAKCALWRLQGAERLVGHRTPLMAGSIAHAFLGLGRTTIRWKKDETQRPRSLAETRSWWHEEKTPAGCHSCVRVNRRCRSRRQDFFDGDLVATDLGDWKR